MTRVASIIDAAYVGGLNDDGTTFIEADYGRIVGRLKIDERGPMTRTNPVTILGPEPEGLTHVLRTVPR